MSSTSAAAASVRRARSSVTGTGRATPTTTPATTTAKPRVDAGLHRAAVGAAHTPHLRADPSPSPRIAAVGAHARSGSVGSGSGNGLGVGSGSSSTRATPSPAPPGSAGSSQRGSSASSASRRVIARPATAIHVTPVPAALDDPSRPLTSRVTSRPGTSGRLMGSPTPHNASRPRSRLDNAHPPPQPLDLAARMADALALLDDDSGLQQPSSGRVDTARHRPQYAGVVAPGSARPSSSSGRAHAFGELVDSGELPTRGVRAHSTGQPHSPGMRSSSSPDTSSPSTASAQQHQQQRRPHHVFGDNDDDGDGDGDGDDGDDDGAVPDDVALDDDDDDDGDDGGDAFGAAPLRHGDSCDDVMLGSAYQSGDAMRLGDTDLAFGTGDGVLAGSARPERFEASAELLAVPPSRRGRSTSHSSQQEASVGAANGTPVVGATASALGVPPARVHAHGHGLGTAESDDIPLDMSLDDDDDNDDEVEVTFDPVAWKESHKEMLDDFIATLTKSLADSSVATLDSSAAAAALNDTLNDFTSGPSKARSIDVRMYHVETSGHLDRSGGDARSAATSTLERIEFGKVLARGASGKVYVGRCRSNNMQVAIKQMRLTGTPREFHEAVEREVSILRLIVHENIIHYYGMHMSADQCTAHIVLEFADSGSLAQLVGEGPLSEPDAANILVQTLNGLRYLHNAKIIHRDLKPLNILVTKRGVVKLTDFGLSTKVLATHSLKQTVVGTPWYCAPEVIQAQPYSFAADIWSIGCVCHELVTGHRPYQNLNGVAAMYRMCEDPMPPLPTDVSPQCLSFLRACWQRRADLRPTVDELLQHEWLQLALKAAPRWAPVDAVLDM